jgi:hypothetical protein
VTIPPQLPSQVSADLLAVASSGDTFLAMDSAAVMRSLDGGATWSHAYTAPAGVQLSRIWGSGAVWAVSGRTSSYTAFVATSTDTGATWRATDETSGLPAIGWTKGVTGRGSVIHVLGHSAVGRSTDGGQTWSSYGTGQTAAIGGSG